MWRCLDCGTYNEDRHKRCSRCGAAKAPSTSPGAAPRAGKPAPKRWVTVLLILLLAALVLMLKTLFIHVWADATCTSPKTCIICGKTSGSPLIHDWLPADCTHPHICNRCGEEEGRPLGHRWLDATYDEPKTCARCGIQEGEPLLFPGELPAHWADEPMEYFGGSYTTYAFILDEPLSGCRGITLTLSIEIESGDPYGIWYFYVQAPDGSWDHVAEFELDDIATDAAEYDLYFDAPLDFGAVTIAPKYEIDYSMSYYMMLSNPK